MLNVSIKFRGVDIKTGNYVYGDLIQSKHNGEIICEIRSHNQNGYPRYKTVEGSIAQLVGYDINGEEIYEGDKVIDSNNDEGYVSLLGIFKHTGNWDSCEYIMKPGFMGVAKLRRVEGNEKFTD